MDKYLTILAGHPRGGEKTWHTLYKNVLTPLNSDLAIVTGSKWLDSQSFINKSKYQWIIDEPEDWLSYYKKNFRGNWEEYFNLGKKTGLYSSGSIHFALKDIILKYYLNELLNYDYIIYSRFDQFYVDKHPKFSGTNIWIPEGEDYFGICDRHAVVPIQYIKKFLSICSYIDSKVALDSNYEHLNCEVSYMNFLSHLGLGKYIKRYKRFQFTAAFSDDFTNWRVPKYKIYFYGKLMIKYPDEYLDSVINFKNKYGIFRTVFVLNKIYFTFLYLSFRKILGNFKKLSIF